MRRCSFDNDYQATTPAAISDLAALRCEIITGSLHVSANKIDTLAGLETIREITGVLDIRDTTKLTDLSGLQGLETVSTLNIAETNGLTSVELPALRTASTVTLTSLPSTQTIALPVLEKVLSSLLIVGDQVLQTFSASSLAQVKSLTMSQNPVLATLSGLPALTTVSDISIFLNPQLPQCEVDALVQRLGIACTDCSKNNANAACN